MRRMITSFFGTGLCPVAPGTAASAAALLPCAAVALLMPEWPWARLLWLVLAFAGSAACVTLAPSAIERTGSPDPPEITVDEAAGVYLAIGLAPPFPPIILLPMVFVAFRALDIIKPFGIARLQRLQAGWGILADDLAAGAAAAAAAWCAYAVAA